MDISKLQTALSAIVTPSTPPGTGVGEAIQGVETFLAEHRGELDPQLRHFLERRSYQKALTYLRDPSPTHQA